MTDGKSGRPAPPVRYLHDARAGMELVVCRGSAVSYPLHNHVSVYTAGLLLEGTLDFTAWEETRTLGAGEWFAAAPYTPHRLEARTPCTLLSICIRREPADTADSAGAAAALLDAAGFAPVSFPAEWVRSRLNEISAQDASEGLPPEDMLRLAEQMERRPGQTCRIEDLARAAWMSKYHLIRRFRRGIGLTPHQFLLQNRIRKAQRMIRGNCSMTEAALTTGFCDQSHFIKQFVRQVGMTPTAYRAAYSAVRAGSAEGGDEFCEQEEAVRTCGDFMG